MGAWLHSDTKEAGRGPGGRKADKKGQRPGERAGSGPGTTGQRDDGDGDRKGDRRPAGSERELGELGTAQIE
jgi:hypothetical protein